MQEDWAKFASKYLAQKPYPTDPTERLLCKLRCDFTRQPDGTFVVTGSISLMAKNLPELPDLSSVIVKGDFICSFNDLTSLRGAPRSVEGIFSCGVNKLTSLEHAPQNLKKMTSDFGTFAAWSEIPEHLRTSPRTKARTALEQPRTERQKTQQLGQDVHQATVLQESVKIRKPVQFRKPPSPTVG